MKFLTCQASVYRLYVSDVTRKLTLSGLTIRRCLIGGFAMDITSFCLIAALADKLNILEFN